MMADETCEVIPDEAMIQKVIKNKQSSPKEYTWFVKTVLSHLYRTWYAKVVETGQVQLSDVISTTDEAYALVNVEGNLKWWTKEAEVMAAARGRSLDADERLSLPKSEYTNGGSKSDGWNEEGINRFDELVAKIKADQESVAGKKFEADFQKEVAAKHLSKKQKRKAPKMITITATNDLDSGRESDDDASVDTGA
jgi:hypothetical protein